MNLEDALFMRWEYDAPREQALIGTTTALLLGAMAASTAGSALAARKKTTTNSSTQETFDPAATAVRNQLGPLLQQRLTQPASLDPGLLTQGLTGINKSFNAEVPAMQDIFSSRGLGQSGLFGGSLNNAALQRMGQIGQLYQQVLSTADARKRADIQQAMQFASPTGQTGTNVSTGPGATAGIGTGLQDVGSLIATIAALKNAGLTGSASSAPANTGLPDVNFNGMIGQW